MNLVLETYNQLVGVGLCKICGNLLQDIISWLFLMEILFLKPDLISMYNCFRKLWWTRFRYTKCSSSVIEMTMVIRRYKSNKNHEITQNTIIFPRLTSNNLSPRIFDRQNTYKFPLSVADFSLFITLIKSNYDILPLIIESKWM